MNPEPFLQPINLIKNDFEDLIVDVENTPPFYGLTFR
jgi:hypothetical protein